MKIQYTVTGTSNVVEQEEGTNACHTIFNSLIKVRSKIR